MPPGRRASVIVAVGVALGCGREFPAGWLYITRVTRDAATVIWTGGESPVACRGPGRPVARALPGRRRAGLHAIRIDGLAAGSRYACRLRPAGGRSRRFRFTTAPAGATPFTFAAVGDTGDGSAQVSALGRRIREDRPAFLLHLGDLAYQVGTAAQFDTRFFRPLRRTLARVPLFPTPGNHDVRRQSIYATLFAAVDDGPGPHYAFDWGAAHFAAVASPALRDDGGAGARWLAADLARAGARPWHIVFLHEPLYTSVRKSTTAGIRAALEPVLEAARVDLVLAGHAHLYERTLPVCEYVRDAGVLQVTAGGGSRSLDRGAGHPNFARSLSVMHYVRVRVAPEAIELSAIGLDGTVLDHVRHVRGQPVPCRADGWPAPRSK